MFAIFWTLLEIDPTCVRINQKFRFKSHSLHTFPLVNSHSDQKVVIKSFQHQLISRIEIGHSQKDFTQYSSKYNRKRQMKKQSEVIVEQQS